MKSKLICWMVLALCLWSGVGNALESKALEACEKETGNPYYESCSRVVRGGTFNPHALDLCNRTYSDDPKLKSDCIYWIEGYQYQKEAVDLCGSIKDAHVRHPISCLYNVAGKNYSVFSLTTCGVYTYDPNKLFSCLESSSSTVIPDGSAQASRQLPSGTQILLKNDLKFPAHNTCVQMKDGDFQQLACDICVTEASDEDRILKARTMIIKQTRQSRNELYTDFEIVNDFAVKNVRCISHRPYLFDVTEKEALNKMLEKIGLSLSIPSPREF